MEWSRLRQRAAVSLVVMGAYVVQPAAAWGQSSVRITMDTLHQLGGVPPGWKLQPPAGDARAGRGLFAKFGCQSCHVVRGDAGPEGPTKGSGPELTGMGGHHPAGYFAESILNPDAVIVEGPGYVGPDGRSTMPRYPEMTLDQLTHLVAYVQSLTTGQAAHPPASASAPSQMANAAMRADLPTPPGSAATRFLVQVYDVQPGRLGELEEWLRADGTTRLLSVPGLVSVETYVDQTRGSPSVISIFAFVDDAALELFTTDPRWVEVGLKFDSFIGPHGHAVFGSPPLYRSDTLSSPAPADQNRPPARAQDAPRE